MFGFVCSFLVLNLSVMNVSLRKMKLKDGNHSLFLDITGHGPRRKEYLKFKIWAKPKNDEQRLENRNNMRLAEDIRAKHQLELRTQIYGLTSIEIQNYNFITYFEEWRDDYKTKFADYRKVDACLNHLNDFLKEKKIRALNGMSLTKILCEDFAEYLNTKVAGPTGSAYFKKFRKILRRAYNEKMISFHPSDIHAKFFVDKNAIKKPLLSEAEIELLMNTPCANDIVASAYLYSYNMGFDYKTISSTLTWECISDRWVNFDRSKTKRNKNYYMNDNAMELLPARGEPKEIVFKVPTWNGCIKIIRKWAKDAGIDKKITWHSARHSFATNLINDYNIGVRTVQEMLGQDDIKSTMKYTHINKQTKQHAAEQIKRMVKKPK